MADGNNVAFDNANSFNEFAYSIRNHRRFIRKEDEERFLAAVRDTCEMRALVINPDGRRIRGSRI